MSIVIAIPTMIFVYIDCRSVSTAIYNLFHYTSYGCPSVRTGKTLLVISSDLLRESFRHVYHLTSTAVKGIRCGW